MTHPAGWTPERVEALHKLYIIDGLSGGEVGRILRVSRNACIGKAHRMGWVRDAALAARNSRRLKPWSAGQTGMARRTARQLERAEARKAKEQAKEADRAISRRARGAREAIWAPLAGSTPRPLEHRASGQCAWPLGAHPQTLFCCEPVDGGDGPYCAVHRRIRRAKVQPSRLVASRSQRSAA